MLFIVSGASGAGKSTLCERLLSDFPTLTLSVSYTTRPPRGREADGVHYHFVDDATFEAMVSEGAFAEWARVHGNSYGSARAIIDGHLAGGRSVLFDVDYQGAESLMAAYPSAAVSVMVLPPDMATLEARLRGRGTDTDEVIAGRLARAQAEMGHAPSFGHLIVNDEFEEAYREMSAIYRAGRTRTASVWPRLAPLLGLRSE